MNAEQMAIADGLKVVCPNCKAVNKLSACFKELKVDELTEGVLECPDCGRITHSYWKSERLKEQEQRLEHVRQIYQRRPSQGRWNNYLTAKDSFSRAFEKLQIEMARKGEA